jgi:hypothetical protein
MESGGKNYDILREVNAWLAVAGENLCDRATAEMRKRMLATVETECQRLENEGLSRELAVKQAIGELGDPEVAKLTLGAKHLTKNDYDQVKRFYLCMRGVSYRKLAPALGLLIAIPLLVLYFEMFGDQYFYLIIGIILAALLLDPIVYLIRVIRDSVSIPGKAEQWDKLSQHIRKQWIYVFWVWNFQVTFLLGERTEDIQRAIDAPTDFHTQYFLLFIVNLGVLLYYRSFNRLVNKVEALENDGFEYVLLPGAATHRG